MRCPRARGDEPSVLPEYMDQGHVVPAHAGMNRPVSTHAKPWYLLSPRTRG